MSTEHCQLQELSQIEGVYEKVPASLSRRLTQILLRPMSPSIRATVKRYTRLLNKEVSKRRYQRQPPETARLVLPAVTLEPGSLVRVRSREEVEATLDAKGKLKGCGVMADMWQYCGTTQRVYKPVERFLDECDYQVKRAKGLLLLDNLVCVGTAKYGPCDRSCFYFWRVEWLERLDE